MPVSNASNKYNTSESTSKTTSEEETTEVETEETEEEGEEDTDSESESENEDNEEDEEEEESDSSETTDEEDDSKQILDLKNVPPQLRAAAKKMLATHTKTIQKLKKEAEERITTLEQDLNEKYSDSVVKAAGWDKLTKIPAFIRWWNNFVENGDTEEAKPRRKNNSEDEDDPAEASEGKGLSEAQIIKIVTRAVRAEIGPLKEEKANDLWAEAEEKLPNFKKYKAAITSFLTKHPSHSISEAYDWVTKEDRVKAEVQKALDKAQTTGKKIPKTLKPGSSGGSSIDRSTIKSLDDAIGAAARKVVGG